MKNKLEQEQQGSMQDDDDDDEDDIVEWDESSNLVDVRNLVSSPLQCTQAALLTRSPNGGGTGDDDAEETTTTTPLMMQTQPPNSKWSDRSDEYAAIGSGRGPTTDAAEREVKGLFDLFHPDENDDKEGGAKGGLSPASVSPAAAATQKRGNTNTTTSSSSVSISTKSRRRSGLPATVVAGSRHRQRLREKAKAAAANHKGKKMQTVLALGKNKPGSKSKLLSKSFQADSIGSDGGNVRKRRLKGGRRSLGALNEAGVKNNGSLFNGVRKRRRSEGNTVLRGSKIEDNGNDVTSILRSIEEDLQKEGERKKDSGVRTNDTDSSGNGHVVNCEEGNHAEKVVARTNQQSPALSPNISGEKDVAQSHECFVGKVTEYRETCVSKEKVPSMEANSARTVTVESVASSNEGAKFATKNEFDDDPFGDVVFNVEDLAAMDNLEKNISYATQEKVKSELVAQPLQQRSNIQQNPQPFQQQQQQHQQQQTISSNDEFGADPFDDLPVIDFDAMDKLIEQRSSSVQSAGGERSPATVVVPSPPNPDAPIWNPTVQKVQNYDDDVACPEFIQFSRYKVRSVQEDVTTCTKTLIVTPWKSKTEKDKNEQYDDSQQSLNEDSGNVLGNCSGHDSEKKGCIFLRGEWYYTQCHEGTIIHLCSISGRYKTDFSALPTTLHSRPPPGSDKDDDLVLVVHPDMLVQPTIVSEVVTCSRRAVIKSRLGSSGLTSRAALVGTMRHDLFERCMSEHDFTIKNARQHATHIVRKHAEALVGIGMINDNESQAEVLRILPQIQRFAMTFTTLRRNSTNETAGRSNSIGASQKDLSAGSVLTGGNANSDIHFCANSVYATEESALSAELGLKGNVDITVAATTKDMTQIGNSISNYIGTNGNNRAVVNNETPLDSLMGLELKTGHNQNPQNVHMAQLSLYTLMLRARHGSAVLPGPSQGNKTGVADHNGASNGGVLLYLNHQGFKPVHISPTLTDLKTLVGQRNQVASELQRAAQPRGISLAYDNDSRDVNQKEPAEKSVPEPRTQILPAPPADLPEVLATPHSCQRCYSNRECMMYAAADISDPTSPNNRGVNRSHAELIQHFTGHLNDSDMRYFRDWDRLIDLESHHNQQEITRSWLVNSVDRETSTGKCISSLILDDFSLNSALCGDSDTACDAVASSNAVIRFFRSPDSTLKTPLKNLKIEARSRVILSTDGTIFSDGSKEHDSELCDYKTMRPSGRRRRVFRHQMHVLRGVLEQIDDNSVRILAEKRDIKQIRELVESFKATGQDDFGLSRKGQTCSDAHSNNFLRFRLDKDEIASGTGTLRQNLINFFTADAPAFKAKTKKMQGQSLSEERVDQVDEDLLHRRRRMSWLRRVVVNLDPPPAFDNNLVDSMFIARCSQQTVGCDLKRLSVEFRKLNPDQRAAVAKVISAKDYALIQGLPGTGKTSTIAFVVRLLVAQGKRVLITSYTHAAVDALTMKLLESGVDSSVGKDGFSPLIRIGFESYCHSSMHPILASNVAAAKENEGAQNNGDSKNTESPSAKSLHEVVSAARIVCVSALTVPRTPLLVNQNFDVVIVDEAGQISQPAILGPLMVADSFVLVGDHMQLPPLVSNDVAEKAGYGVSMLKRLADKFPNAVAQLTLQYRMHGDICDLCNEVVYKGALKCANERVRSEKLRLSSFPDSISIMTTSNLRDTKNSNAKWGWLHCIVDPNRPAIFADTDTINNENVSTRSSGVSSATKSTFIGLERARGRSHGGNIVNETEAHLVRIIVRGLIDCGLEASTIGVICPYRAQIRLFNEDPFFTNAQKSGLEISTIDRYQGRDKSAIVLSFVRSNSEGKAGRLLEDFRRLNVAVSRAKQKLIMIGSFCTLTKGSKVLRPVLVKMKNQNWIEKLPHGATQLYTS